MIAENHVLFGIHNEAKNAEYDDNEIADLSEFVEDLLGIQLEGRETAHGDPYYAFPLPNRSLYLKTNFLVDEGEVSEGKFPDYAYLLYLNNPQQNRQYLAAVEARPDIFVKLRTEEA
ncbi:hypothetical protein [Phyllobacterium sp. YR531]|uniref:hypothetical protein n=1 Tax=Phyllobacterium sp. YR531 TaxID=1144343 RepID=UPI00026F9030|nr:hypothetical protein [Phyllobacterium sp. YR531]EJN01407.1 hypothetical protein PMI41_03489 [Phyllobacterium sp. YR531]